MEKKNQSGIFYEQIILGVWKTVLVDAMDRLKSLYYLSRLREVS